MIRLINKSKFIFIILSIFSFFLYEGLIGGDHKQVTDFILSYDSFNGSFNEFLKISNWSFELSHRYIWIFHDLIIFYISNFIFFFNQSLSTFAFTYLAGWILTFYFFISFYIFYQLIRDKCSFVISIIISISLFFGTTLISLFTGFVQEPMTILLIVLRFKNRNYYLKLLIDFLIIAIKPFYILIVLGMILSGIKNFKNFKKSLQYLIFLLIIFISFRLFLLGSIINTSENLNIIYQFYMRAFDIENILINVFNIFFSISFGQIFLLSIPYILIIYGNKGISTYIKFLFFLLLCIFLGTVPFWHGHMAGSRFLAPAIFIFIPEFIRASEKLEKLDDLKFKKIILILICIFSFLNLPSLEYRNTSIHDYKNNSAYYTEPSASRLGFNDLSYDYYDLNDLRFHPLIFAVNICFVKIMDKDFFIYRDITITKKNIYPASGLARLIYIHDQGLLSSYALPIKINSDIFLILKLFYCLFFIFLPTSLFIYLCNRVALLKY